MHRIIVGIALGLFSIAAFANPGTVTLEKAAVNRLADLSIGEKLEVDFPAGPGLHQKVSFERIDVYAPGARIVVIDDNGEREIPRSERIHLLGHSADGRTRLSLSFDPGMESAPEGAGTGLEGAFIVTSTRVGDGWKFAAITPEASYLPDAIPQFSGGEDSIPNPHAPLEALSHLGAESIFASTPARIAVVAIDTDTTFMSKRFSGNTAQATAWIADLFAQMNVIYRRDLDVILQQGTTFLRVASDPYANADTSATGAQLDEFGAYWAANYSTGANAVSRSFAALLSGNSSSGNSSSGIAWVNSYCRTPSYGGSYSTNQIFTNPAVGISSTVSIVAHELGHNFGASHTHCSNATTGSSPTSTNTIDQCYKAEPNCYAGITSCPSSGPGAPKGSLMSYCHVGGTSGASGCGSNSLQFHPTHITQLRGRIAANSPSCLRSEVIFTNGFQ